MPSMPKEIEIGARPYEPSWVDRFNDWVADLPIRVWVFHVVFAIVLILIQLLLLWLEGGLRALELVPVIVFNGLATPFLLWLIHLLDSQAVTSANSMKALLDTTWGEFAEYEYRLSNMPILAPLLAGLALVVFSILMPQVTPEPARYAGLEELPVFAVVFHIIDKSSAFLFGVILYHTLRQLGLVNEINSTQTRINLFHLEPLQAFSRLTALTAVGLVVFLYLWMVINPDLLTDPVNLVVSAVFTFATVLAFVWPLYGIHGLMEEEKRRALREIDRRLDAVFSKFNDRFDKDDYAGIERLHGLISSLEIQRRRVKVIPTWPWSPETARIALTAIALPLVLTFLQLLATQVLGW